MSRDDKFDDVLGAFASDLKEPFDQEELDRVYSDAVAEGLVNPDELKRSFENFLNRCVDTIPDTEEIRLAPRPPATVGSLVKAGRTSRGLTRSGFARELHLQIEDIRAIEACKATYDPEHLSEAARALASTVQSLTEPAAKRIIRRVRVSLGLQSAIGPFLKAARRPPRK